MALAWTSLAAAQPPAPSPVAARVDGHPISVRQVRREVGRVVRGREVEPDAASRLEAEALEQCVLRRLVIEQLRSQGQAATAADIDVEVTRLEKRLKEDGQRLEDHMAATGIDLVELRDAFEWQLTWQRHLNRYLTDENLERYFEQHRREFDGTRLRVSQILLKADPNDATAVAAARARAQEIRAEVVGKPAAFADAARQWSQSPTGADGGDSGEITREGPMHESFTRAAFALRPGEISPPVTSPFGVHLILVREETPGQLRWNEVRDRLVPAVGAHLLRWTADQRRMRSKIEWTGATARLDADGTVVPPSLPAAP